GAHILSAVTDCRYKRLIDDLEAHLAGGAGDDTEAGFVAARVQVFAFQLHDVHDLFASDFADFRFVRLLGTGGNVRRLLQQDRSRWGLGDEGERLVFEDGDDDRENVAGLLL